MVMGDSLNAKPLKLTIGAENAILINGNTGAILFEKEAHQPAFPASTTKIASALYALKIGGHNLQQKITANSEAIASITTQAKKQSNYRSPAYWLETNSTHIGIKKGEEFSLFDLLSAMLISSANDASNVIAQSLGGTIPKFMDGVNLYLKEIGCNHTNFNNPHGLHHPDHQTTAYDLAQMTLVALKDPLFRQIVSTARYQCPQTNLEFERTLLQTNLLLRQGSYYYPKAIGVKTGTTQAAGKSLVAAAEDQGRLLIAVVLGYKGEKSELYNDVIKIFEAAFNEPKMRRRLLSEGSQSFTKKVDHGRGLLKTYLPEDLTYDFYPSEEMPVRASVQWEIPPLPIVKDAQVGVIKVTDNEGRFIKEAPLLAEQPLLPSLWYSYKKVWLGLGLSSMLLTFWQILRRIRPRRRRAR